MKITALLSAVLLSLLVIQTGCTTGGMPKPENSSPRVSTGVPAGGVYNVRAFGATGDGKTLDHTAINKAIDACAEAGGGTVFIPAGTYLSGSIELKSNIHLLLDAGATILGAPQNMNAYDQEEPFTGPAYQDGGHTFFHNSLIWGENLTNISITGQGTINGGGLVSSDGNEDRVDGFGSGRGAPGAAQRTNTVTTTPGARLGNKAIALKLCRNVLLRDFTIIHGGHFAILVTGCDNMTVDNVTMDTNRDGIDIDCCRNTMVSNCRINSPRDDALCPKSSFALGRNVITENLTIVNCQVSGFLEGTLIDGTMKPGQGNGRIKFGTEANGGFRNCTVDNCTFRGCKGLALEEVDGGIMENITINNLTMMDTIGYPIYVTTGKRNRGPDVTVPSRARNIFISNIIADGIGNSAIEITGMEGQPIENLRLQNISLHFKGGGTAAQATQAFAELGTGYPEPRGVTPSYGVFARHVKGLELANVKVSFEKEDLRPAMMATDVDGLQIDQFRAQLASGVAAAKLDAVKGLVVHDSPVLDGITVANP
jgi:polygalacturonase